jgi:hypothetical protein
MMDPHRSLRVHLPPFSVLKKKKKPPFSYDILYIHIILLLYVGFGFV